MGTHTLDFIEIETTMEEYIGYSSKLGIFLTVARFFHLNSQAKNHIESLVNIGIENGVDTGQLNLSELEHKAFAKLNTWYADQENRKMLLEAIIFVVENKLLQNGKLNYRDTTGVNLNNGYRYFDNIRVSNETKQLIKSMSARERFFCQLHVATITAAIGEYKPEQLGIQAVPLLKSYLTAEYINKATKVKYNAEEIFLFYGAEDHYNDSFSVSVSMDDSKMLYFKGSYEEPSDFTLKDLLSFPHNNVRNLEINISLQSVSSSSLKLLIQEISRNKKFRKVNVFGTFVDNKGIVAEIPTFEFMLDA